MKTIIYILVIGAVAFGIYSLSNNKNTTNQEVVKTQEDSTEKQSEVPNSNGKKMAFSEFAKQGGSYQCSVKQYLDDFDTKGEVFIDKGNIRGEFNTVTEGMSITNSILVRDGFTYVWSSFSPKTGFKIPIKASSGDADTSTKGTYSWGPEQIGEYDCMPWVPTEEKFAIPTGISFTLMK